MDTYTEYASGTGNVQDNRGVIKPSNSKCHKNLFLGLFNGNLYYNALVTKH